MSWQEKIQAHQAVFEALREQENQVNEMGRQLVQVLKSNGCAYVAGNGGSAADAQHFAAELTGRFLAERRALAGVALTTDTSALTAIANDYGYDEVFSRQLAGLARKGDIFIGISTSGNSPNILRALEMAKQKGIVTLGLTGRDGGAMLNACDLCLVIPSTVTAHIQEAHIFTIHHWCAMVDEAFA
ncbi:D-sedoheptulose-7-phosphate isomerase [Suttonella ornithocola]|uniref:Phosphoheptose isomerase n=1 Tax=Suttonella ornithocola TaxID=279832 RepID=A0A380MSY6_9GAMM|nr:D-sedoheptulose 7-phosphate isomerase [Suttonella ornithocola]SUO95033.1 Phosphoheptose isomerase 1 [Suttonella ornithocola]